MQPATDQTAMPARRRKLVFADVERRRRHAGLAANALIAAARINPRTWILLQRGIGADDPRRQNTLRRLLDAIDALQAAQAAKAPSAIVALVRVVEMMLRERVEGRAELEAALGIRRRRQNAARLRHLVIYLVAVELEISNADIARALGITRQAVKQVRDDVEGLRDRPIVDAWLDSMAVLIRGGV